MTRFAFFWQPWNVCNFRGRVLRVDEGIRNLASMPDDLRLLALRGLVFTPDGSRLLGLTYAGVRMWDTRTAYPPPEREGGR